MKTALVLVCNYAEIFHHYWYHGNPNEAWRHWQRPNKTQWLPQQNDGENCNYQHVHHSSENWEKKITVFLQFVRMPPMNNFPYELTNVYFDYWPSTCPWFAEVTLQYDMVLVLVLGSWPQYCQKYDWVMVKNVHVKDTRISQTTQ